MDVVQEPQHYQTNTAECIEIMKEMSTEEEFEGFLKLTAYKYLYRYNDKNDPIEDLSKAIQYLTGLKNLKENPDIFNVFRPSPTLDYEPEDFFDDMPECGCGLDFDDPYEADMCDCETDMGLRAFIEELFAEEEFDVEPKLVDPNPEPRALIIYACDTSDAYQMWNKCDIDEYFMTTVVFTEQQFEDVFEENPNADVEVTQRKRDQLFSTII